MKCAIELMAMAKEAENLRLEKEAKDLEEACLQAIARAKRTVEWCEAVLSPYLEKYAINHESFGQGMWSWEYGDGHPMHFAVNYQGHLLPLHQYFKYANGQMSYTSYGEPLDKQVIIDYCAKHCLEVRSRIRNYKKYGGGVRSGLELEYRISPECFQEKK